MIRKAFILLALILLLGSVSPALAQGTWLDAAPGISSDKPVQYLLESIKERLSLLFVRDSLEKADRVLSLAEERLAEAEAHATRKAYKFIGADIKRYEKEFKEAGRLIALAKSRGKDVTKVTERLYENYVRHLAVLEHVLQRVPDEAKPAIEKAIENATKGYESASAAVTKEKQEQIHLRIRERIPDEVLQKLPEKVRSHVRAKTQ